MTNIEFNKAFKPLLDYFPDHGLTKERINIYFLALSDLTFEQLRDGIVRIIRERIWEKFPQAAEIRDYAVGETKDLMDLRVNIAREKIKLAIIRYGAYRSVKFDDLGIHCFIDSVGGWQKLCMMDEKEFQNCFRFDSFEKTYKSYWALPRNVSEHYLGITDFENNTLKINYIENQKLGIESEVLRITENKTELLKGAEK